MTFTETKIRGLEIKIDENNIIIIDAYKINDKQKMKMIIERALEKSNIYITKRKIASLIKEWVSHNRLYKLHFFRKINKNCVLSKRVPMIGKIVYSILGV